MNEFSPPYGDSTILIAEDGAEVEFSPPYGDCTKKAFYED